jgi:rhodanese-related sulfurtransferase
MAQPQVQARSATAAAFSSVLETPAAEPSAAAAHFAGKLAFETDPSDVHADLGKGIQDFIVVDCRSPESFAKGHVPGAVNLHYRRMTAETVRPFAGKTVVAYCTSVHCNASAKGALRLAQLGVRVKEMTGGIRGWEAEGYAIERGP